MKKLFRNLRSLPVVFIVTSISILAFLIALGVPHRFMIPVAAVILAAASLCLN